ncbi:AAA family ATPase [Salipiger thiooxidans]|uniref:KAP family P-loop NTPase fold protein n=1 Tax=Salipiger thiooxidans TaxID=282683 RepID=UPI001A90CBB5|nr:P-loop NTPase fold protein [Salipiger thiooxidans]MBN8190433.1 AAA family ATPase [Salipiger thiooxidans]
MHLLPPQPEIALYDDGFDINDILNRATIGKDLSNLIERIEDPLVIALDGPWGSGKSHFLKRWVGAHCKDNGGTATTVYFDAFKSDFLDDPLIALTGAIAEKLENGAQGSRWQQAKTAAVKLYRPALRIGLAAATGGISEYTGAVLDAAVAASSKEAEQAAEAFWRREDGRKAAMQQFTDALTKLTQGEGSEDPGKPLVIVIDELDRCRPDYALATLEVIKHFFAVPRVHFVLGVNLEALGHIVRSRYGADVNAQEYLKRFFTLSIELPDEVPGDRSLRAELKYFVSTARKMNLPATLVNEATSHLKLSIPASQISLRDIEKILSSIALSSAGRCCRMAS